MKKSNIIFIFGILLIIPIPLFAQTNLNSFLRNASYWQVSTNGEEHFEDASNMYIVKNGPDLHFSFTQTWKGFDGGTNYTKYKVTIDLGRASIYNGFWSSWGGEYTQTGDKSVVTIKQNSIKYELNHSFVRGIKRNV